MCSKYGVDISYVTHTNETKLCDYDIVKHLPMFYQQIFISFNECKKYVNVTTMSTETFLSQPLWKNRLLV